MTQISSGSKSRSISGPREAAERARMSAAGALVGCVALVAWPMAVAAQPPASAAPAPRAASSAASAPVPPAATAPTSASTPELRQLWEAEQTWARALTTGSPDLLEQLVDSEFSFIGPDGEYEDREAYLAGYRALPAQGVRVLGLDMFDVKLRDLGQTAIATGRVVARVQMGAQTIIENVRFTRVYARRGAGWRMVAGQGTRLVAAPR